MYIHSLRSAISCQRKRLTTLVIFNRGQGSSADGNFPWIIVIRVFENIVSSISPDSAVSTDVYVFLDSLLSFSLSFVRTKIATKFLSRRKFRTPILFFLSSFYWNYRCTLQFCAHVCQSLPSWFSFLIKTYPAAKSPPIPNEYSDDDSDFFDFATHWEISLASTGEILVTACLFSDLALHWKFRCDLNHQGDVDVGYWVLGLFR